MSAPSLDWLRRRTILRTGAAGHLRTPDGLRFLNLPQAPNTPRIYANAQVDDYHGLPRSATRNRPPLRLTVRARFSHCAGDMHGTAGFGFWNDPFGMSGARLPAPPRAAWFFLASPHSNMALARGVPGWGWKAAVIDAGRMPAPLLYPAAPAAALLMHFPALYRRLWPLAQRVLGVNEAIIGADPREWHTYSLHWGPSHTRFFVDGALLLDAPSPRGPLGLVVWIDTQWMVVSPQGRVRGGIAPLPHPQWMEIGALEIDEGAK